MLHFKKSDDWSDIIKATIAFTIERILHKYLLIPNKYTSEDVLTANAIKSILLAPIATKINFTLSTYDTDKTKKHIYLQFMSKGILTEIWSFTTRKLNTNNDLLIKECNKFIESAFKLYNGLSIPAVKRDAYKITYKPEDNDSTLITRNKFTQQAYRDT